MDCEKLRGRLRDICRGHDKHGKPIDMPEWKRQKYLAMFEDSDSGFTLHRQPGVSGDAATVARRERVARRVAAAERLRGWLAFLRHPKDEGIGDTASRLLACCERSPDAKARIGGLLKRCNCTPADAVTQLNERYPYLSDVRIVRNVG